MFYTVSLILSKLNAFLPDFNDQISNSLIFPDPLITLLEEVK